MVKIKSFRVYFLSFIRKFSFRLAIVLLSIILCFNTVCKPKRVDASAMLTFTVITTILSTITGLAGVGLAYYQEAKNDSSLTEDDMVEYFNEQITVDGDGNYVISDAGMVTINAMKEAYESDIAYQNMYLPSAEQLNASNFATKSAYSKLYTLIKKHPDKIFAVSAARHNYNNFQNIAGWTIRVHDADICGISANINTGFGMFQANLYDSEWQSNFAYTEFYLCDTSVNSMLIYKDSSGTWVELSTVEEVEAFDMNLATNTYTGGCGTYFGSSSAFFNTDVAVHNQVFTSFNGAFPVYATVNDMKNGTAGGSVGQFMPNYVPGTVTDNSVTQTEITEYNTNYNNYYGSGGSGGSGSGGSDTDSSGGSWLNGILGALDKIGDVIMSLLAKALDIVTSILKFFTDTLLEAVDIVPGGVVNLLQVFFPYVPPEWITAISLALALLVIGLIIKLFK